MPFSNIASRIDTPGFNAPPPAVNVALQAMEAIYNGSPGAAAAMEGWLQNHPGQNIIIQFLAGTAQAPLPLGGGRVQIDPAYFKPNIYLSDNGTAVFDTFLSGLTHELGHAIGGWADNDSFNDLAGENVTNVNQWLSELGFENQASYNAYTGNLNLLDPGREYTNGESIENAILDIGQVYANPYGLNFDTRYVDLTYEGVAGSTLIVGGMSDNDYKGTVSRDWIYGGGGVDTLDGGDGDDMLIGGADGDELVGNNGNDTVTYADSAAGVTIDLTLRNGSNDSATVVGLMTAGASTDATGDRIASVEVIVGSDFADVISADGSGMTVRGGAGQDELAGGANDILFGESGDDVISSTGGGTSMIGGDGADIFLSGAGDDVIWGGAEGQDGWEEAQVDVVDYSATTSACTIQYTSTAGIATVTASGSEIGSDTLHAVEMIKLGSGYASFLISGPILQQTQLTIDATGGSGFASPTIVGQGTSAGLTISIGANGAGTVSNGGGGAINLLGFHTRVIASEFDDTIVDDSAGNKRFDVGFGDDVVSTAGSSGNVEIFGGWGSDHLTGGSGNDFIVADDLGSPDGVILPGGLGLNLGDGVDFLSGGDGSDYLIAFGSNDTVLGGAGDDLIEIFDGASFGDNDSPSGLIQGGSGNDVIRYVGSELGELAISFGAGDGHDLLDTSEASGEPFIDLRIPDVELNDITIIIDQNAQGFSIGGGGYQDFSGVSDIVIRIESTGDTFYLENRSLQYDSPFNGREYDQYTSFGNMSINGENQFLNFLYANPPGVEIGDISAYRTDLTAFNLARAPDTGDLQGTEGNDDLAGGRGDDVLDGGDGDDTFSASGGDDVIAGGSGNDTLFLFGSRSDYDFSGDAGQFTVVDRTGRDGSIDATSVERFFFATEASFYTAEDIFGYFGTEGDDVIEGSGYDNYIYGLGGDDQLSGGDGIDIFYGGSGNDTIDGGADNDGVVFSGVSTDYVVTTLPDGTTRVEDISAGNADGIDLLINVEAILFEGDGVYMFLPAGGGPGGNSLVGTSGGDQLSGSPDADYLTGGADPTGFGGGGPPIALAETEWVLEGDQADELLGQAPPISDWDELFATPASLSAPITASDHGATLALAQFGLPPLAHDGTPLFIV
ncbi:calcium-binding protein [Citromicrobium bathyomarinum]